MRRILILAGALLCTDPALANELDLSFNSDAFRFRFARPFNASALAWDAGWLHHKDNGEAIHGGFYLTGEASDGANPLQGGLGVRATYTNGDIKDQDGLAFGLGGYLRYVFPRYNRFSVSGHAFFAPEVFHIGESDKLQDYEVRLGYNVLREADIYVGARYVRADYDKAPKAYFDTGMHLGLSLRF
ncbi:MAG: YfaZ family outer membrane protein [Gammaproteobacteria bacterium]|nr:YfaZ family outer membrane protein [Gammaproteobacteria bacterium]